MRWASVTLALLRWGWLRRAPTAPRRILVLHQLLLGDTLMLTGLLAKLRARHPAADIVMTVSPAQVPLYATRPFGVVAQGLDARDFATFRALLRQPRFDLAILPADNRWSWLARALGARWIVGIAGDRPRHKNWPVDELHPYSPAPAAFVETAASLVAGAAPVRFRSTDWPPPAVEKVPDFGPDFALLHVGASSALKLWPPERWRALASWLEGRGFTVVWSAGPGEDAIVRAIDADSGRASILGTLSLAALWQVLRRSRLLVCPDTGIAHLGRVAGVPTVTLFGPGSALICGPGEYFADRPGRVVTVEDFPCRDQSIQFFREVPWARRCERLHGTANDRCPRPRCMEAIAIEAVCAAIEDLVEFRKAPGTE